MCKILWLSFLLLTISTKQVIKDGVYNIIYYNRNFLNVKNNNIQISASKKFEDKSNFRIKKKPNNSFYIIEHVKTNLKLSFSSSNLKLINNNSNTAEWNLIESGDKFYIKNRNKCYLRYNGQKLTCENCSQKAATKFSLIKVYEEVNNSRNDINLIEKEPIDVLIKYIDLSDPTLKREGIPQIKKDENNQELKYCVRSILKNIPWVRKIFILMPNKKVRFFKEYNLINDKIVYVNDKDFLGYDSANIYAFQFRYHQMEYFNISENFITMDDDYFIGKPLKKTDFFYVENGRVVPAIVANTFKEETQTTTRIQHNSYLKKAKKKKGQTSEFFMYSVYTTYRYIIQLLNKSLTVPYFTHNAIPCNLKELKEIYDLVSKSKHKYSTLDSINRHFESLQFQTFYMSYTFNKYNKKVHPISYNYIDNEASITGNYNFPLFCINTGQKDYSDLSFKKARITMENLFPEPTKYELLNHTELPSIAYNIAAKMEKEINDNKKEIKDLKKIKSDEKMKEELEKLKKELEKYKKENEVLKRENDSLRMEKKILSQENESLKLKIKDAEKERDFVENHGKDDHINNLVNLFREKQEKEKIIEKQKYEKEIKDNYFIGRITYFKKELYDKNNIINNLKINNEKLRMTLNIYFYLFVIVILLISIYFVYKKIMTDSQNNNKDENEDENDKLNNDIQKEEKKDSFQVMEMKEIIN